MLTSIKNTLKRAQLADAIWTAKNQLSVLPRRVLGIDSRIIRDYLTSTPVRCLHLGCGFNIKEGWLNTDLSPTRGAAYLDTTKAFAIPSDTFDFIFTEHMIEHIPQASACSMLSECFRILRPGGVLRVSTPNLAFLIDLYNEPKKPIHAAYCDWSVTQYPNLRNAIEPKHTYVINNFVRDWGHQFIYDFNTLRAMLEKYGFTQIRLCPIRQSDHSELCNLENVDRMPAGFLELESLIIEATKANRTEESR